MDEYDPRAIEGVLVYLYTNTYPTISRTAARSEAKGVTMQGSKVSQKSIVPPYRWQTDLGIFVLADKLGLIQLKSQAERYLRLEMQVRWASMNVHELLREL